MSSQVPLPEADVYLLLTPVDTAHLTQEYSSALGKVLDHIQETDCGYDNRTLLAQHPASLSHELSDLSWS